MATTYDVYSRGQSADQGGSSIGIPTTGGLGPVFQIAIPCAAGGATGAADDVTVTSALPFKAVLTDVKFYTSTATAMSTVTLRTATAGAGTALTSDISSGSTGAASTAFTGGTFATLTVAKDTALYLRRSDRAVVGTLVVSLVPIQS